MIVHATFGATAARALESGALGALVPGALSRSWASRARVSRPVVLPAGAAIIGVGGATLGGSYKTPLVLALARALGTDRRPVAVHAHGYGSRPGPARCVTLPDSASSAGDDAIWLFRELRGLGVPIVVGGTRTGALRFAASLAPRVLSDALLQTSPERLALSILVVDAARPWGAGSCPPSGDLRASRSSLLAAADIVVRVSAEGRLVPDPPLGAGSRRVFDVTSELVGGENLEGREVSLSSFAGMRSGLVLAIARPDRVLRALRAQGIVPSETRLFRDHAAPHRRFFRGERSLRPEVWLTTPKCATKMGSTYEGAPVVLLRQRLALPEPLLEAVREF